MPPRTLEERISRIEAYIAIQNLFGTYVYLHSAGLEEETVELFAHHTPDVRAEISNWGVYKGFDSIRRLFVGLHNAIEGDRVGLLVEHDLTSPVIEVAGDGQTARGVWCSPGFETMKHPQTGKLEAHWNWGRYELDFIKEDGEWKIWHFHRYSIFNTLCDTDWVKTPRDPGPFPSQEFPPDVPTTYFAPYTVTSTPKLKPAPPKPYETYSE